MCATPPTVCKLVLPGGLSAGNGGNNQTRWGPRRQKDAYDHLRPHGDVTALMPETKQKLPATHLNMYRTSFELLKCAAEPYACEVLQPSQSRLPLPFAPCSHITSSKIMPHYAAGGLSTAPLLNSVQSLKVHKAMPKPSSTVQMWHRATNQALRERPTTSVVWSGSCLTSAGLHGTSLGFATHTTPGTSDLSKGPLQRKGWGS